MPDLGKSIKWPAPPRQFSETQRIVRRAYLRWRAFMVLSKYPRDKWPELFLKLTAMDILKGKRNSWGIER